VVVVNQATVGLGVDLLALVRALQIQVNRDLYPVWGARCKLRVADSVPAGAWGLVFLDDADSPGALGYHTDDGQPLGKVFVKTTISAGEQVSVTASHELLEMLVDPAANICVAPATTDTIYAYELCDPVEEQSYRIGGVTVSNFAYPTWFEEFHKPGSVAVDHLRKLSAPFEISPGGYMPVFENGKWTQIFASADKRQRFAREDRRGHRSEQRFRRKPRLV
jgi:hypothetical protein